jgi:hypothetical protein
MAASAEFRHTWTTLDQALAAGVPGSDERGPRSDDLPGPVVRYLSHAVRGWPTAGTSTGDGDRGVSGSVGVRLRLTGSVVQRGRRLALTAEELLLPGRGFAWQADARLGPLRLTVRDHYLEGDSAVDIRLLDLVLLGREHGPDTTMSSRGRLAGEAIWAPHVLAGSPAVRWDARDDDHVDVTQVIDGAEESVTLRIDEQGAVREVTMQRWGDGQQRRPYGFAVRAERTMLGGVTIPTEVDGGWGYGSESYDQSQASRFEVVQAALR